MANGNNILLTRPRNRAIDTAKILHKLGYIVHILPLYKISALTKIIYPKQKPDIVIITSKTSLDNAPQKLLNIVQNAEFICVGKRTATKAKQLGFNVIAIYPDTARMLKQNLIIKGEIYYICGKQRNPLLEQNIRCTAIECYEASISDKLHYLIRQKEVYLHSIDIVLATSVFNAQMLNNISKYFSSDVEIVCFSQRVADQIKFGRKHIIKEPNEGSAIDYINNLAFVK